MIIQEMQNKPPNQILQFRSRECALSTRIAVHTAILQNPMMVSIKQ